MLEKKKDCKLTHIFSSHFHGFHNESTAKLKESKKNVEIVIGNYGNPQAYNTKLINELQPIIIGDLSVCLLHTPGHTMDSCVVAITHVNETSTKLPILFT
jgi:glyoxylase-like metal-dependent hydrolase (beta-lactamase superfamily II)